MSDSIIAIGHVLPGGVIRLPGPPISLQWFDSVCGVDRFADIRRVAEERVQVFPVRAIFC